MCKERYPSSSSGDIDGILDRILEDVRPERKNLIDLLHRIQSQCGFIPQQGVSRLADSLAISQEEIASVVTFYRAFNLSPRGRHLITVCTGTACHVRGAQGIVDELHRVLGVDPGETTPDGLATLETVNCVGACALGPIVISDGTVHGQMKAGEAGTLIERVKSKDEDRS
jgi:NADH:ubiquinone oxidoreductase subunit E